jgi:hypothetical protein
MVSQDHLHRAEKATNPDARSSWRWRLLLLLWILDVIMGVGLATWHALNNELLHAGDVSCTTGLLVLLVLPIARPDWFQKRAIRFVAFLSPLVISYTTLQIWKTKDERRIVAIAPHARLEQ